MMQGFEHVSAEAKHYYNLGIHEILLLAVGIPQLYLNLMDFCQFSSQGSNLGNLYKGVFDVNISGSPRAARHTINLQELALRSRLPHDPKQP
jgi:hypothetical protein